MENNDYIKTVSSLQISVADLGDLPWGQKWKNAIASLFQIILKNNNNNMNISMESPGVIAWFKDFPFFTLLSDCFQQISCILKSNSTICSAFCCTCCSLHRNQQNCFISSIYLSIFSVHRGCLSRNVSLKIKEKNYRFILSLCRADYLPKLIYFFLIILKEKK